MGPVSSQGGEFRSGVSCRCEPGIDVIVKMKSSWGRSGGGSGWM